MKVAPWIGRRARVLIALAAVAAAVAAILLPWVLVERAPDLTGMRATLLADRIGSDWATYVSPRDGVIPLAVVTLVLLTLVRTGLPAPEEIKWTPLLFVGCFLIGWALLEVLLIGSTSLNVPGLSGRVNPQVGAGVYLLGISGTALAMVSFFALPTSSRDRSFEIDPHR